MILIGVGLQHTERTFYGTDQSVRRSDSGYLVVGEDRHLTRYLEGEW